MRHYEDIQIGETNSVGHYLVTEQEIIEFASNWDPQPYHIDEQAAKESVFKGLVGTSSHAYALCAKLSLQRPQKTAILAALGIESMNFPNPLRPGATVRLENTCLEKRLSKSHPDCGIVKNSSQLLNQDDKVILQMISNTLVACRSD